MASPRQALSQSSFVQHFSTVEDPRKEGLCDHLLLDILVIAVMVVICGADGWDEIHDWGCPKEPLLRKLLTLPGGIPSADTYRRVFARIAPSFFDRPGIVFLELEERLGALRAQADRVGASGDADSARYSRELRVLGRHLRPEPTRADRGVNRPRLRAVNVRRDTLIDRDRPFMRVVVLTIFPGADMHGVRSDCFDTFQVSTVI